MKLILTALLLIALAAIYWVAPTHVIFRIRCAAATVFSAPPIILANIEQGTLAQPNIKSTDRITGKAVFFPDGQVGGYDLGSIKMHKIELSPERESSTFAIDGANVQSTETIVSIKPIWSIEGNQFHTAIQALLWLGTRNADVTQSAATAATFVFTAQLGQTFDIGKRNITITSVEVAASGKVADVDYFPEANKGLIRIPNVAAGIAAGASVTVTYNCPLIVRD